MNRIALFSTAAALALSIALPTWAQTPAISKADSDLNAAWQQMAVANYAPGFQAALMAWRQEQIAKAAAEVKAAQAASQAAQKASDAQHARDAATIAALNKQLADARRPDPVVVGPQSRPMTLAPGSR